jgi:pimeloyl-ACP methyl ester carboxylesterase
MSTAALIAAALLLVVGLPGAALAGFSWRVARKVETALPPSGRMIEVPGATLHVREQGSGPALLLIHGLAGQMAHYTYGVADRLAGEYRVVTVDRPGSGYSVRAAAGPADLSAQAAALAALIAKLDLGRPLVVGHSLGGAVALALALEHPGQVSGLALIAPVTHLPERVPQVFAALTIRPRWLRTLFAWTLATPGSIARSAQVLGQVFGPEPVPDDFATRGGGLHSLRPRQFLSACADLQALPLRLPQQELRYAELRLPVSVLFAREDRILDWRANGQALVDKVRGATLRLVDGGHMLPITNPELTAQFIREAAAKGNDARDAAAG